MKAVTALACVALILVILAEAFEALVLPRQVTRPFRFSRVYYRTAWWLWGLLADWIPAGRRRETFLSVFGPLSLLALFALWAAGLIVAYGLLYYAVDPDSDNPLPMVYLSGVTFTTLGYGDRTPAGTPGRLLAVLEAGTGIGFFAVVIAYLPVLYQAFSRRETLISLLDARAGSPPSAGRMLLRLPPGREDGALLRRFLEDAERWAAELLESHLSFPALSYYRSQHDNQSYLAGLVCALDASALLLTVVEGVDRQQARLTFAMTRHALVDVSLILKRRPACPESDRFPEARLRAWCGEMRKADVAVRDDAAAVAHLAELRALYEPFAAAMAVYFRLTLPEVWPAGDRPDNWQTSAWMKRARPITALGMDPRDEHFD